MTTQRTFSASLRKLGWLTLAAFTVKGIATASLIVWALVMAAG
jgi:hypothetical protein